MKRRRIWIIGFGILFGIQNVLGQVNTDSGSRTTNPLPDWVYKNEERRRAMDAINGKDKNGMILKPGAKDNPSYTPTPEQREKLRVVTEEVRAEMERKKILLRAPAEYYRKYESLLKNEKVGLARLFVDKNCDAGKTVSVRELERCNGVIEVKGGGSYYSFRFKSNDEYSKDWWDIHFIKDKFVVGNDSVQGIISEIGDVDLSVVDLKSRELDFLNDYKPKRSLAEIKEQNVVLEKGINSNGFNYSNSTPVKLNSTYVLRSIAYRVKSKTQDNDNKGADITLIFKVVGIEKDGSLIILWKELKTDLLSRTLS